MTIGLISVSVSGNDPLSFIPAVVLALAIDERIEIEGGGGTAPLSFDKRRTQRLDPRFGHGRILPLQNEYQIWYIRPMAVGCSGLCNLASRMKKGSTTKLRLNPKKRRRRIGARSTP